MAYKGKILVIGGGTAGIESALQLSSLGYGVYLVEGSDKLGGMINELHRIYPVCACCKFDPRIFSLEQDPNVKVFLNTQVKEISGEKGNFHVTLNSSEGESSINVAAIVLAGGIEPFDPSTYENYAYSHPDVLTSIEYEQMQRPLGPNSGIIKKPSNGEIPKKIAWLQCVGSRDINRCDAPYCSSVCCMYALKEALNTKEVYPDIETTIFYMDIRAHGKGFEQYLNTAIEKGVRLIRCRIHTIEPNKDGISIKYVSENGEPVIEKFDLVVLSVGLRPSKDMIELAKKIGVELDQNGFILSKELHPGETNIPGIFACGAIVSPQDISQSICQADSVISLISSEIEPEPFKTKKEPPEIRDVTKEEPKIALAYYIGADIPEERKNAFKEILEQHLDGLKAKELKGDFISEISELIKETNANRLIFVSCSPTIHKPLIQDALRSCGLNPYLYETVDLRTIYEPNQIKEALKIAIARITSDAPLSVMKVPVIKHALVVGGGVTGLEAALSISEQGYPVTIVEKTDRLGGHARFIKESWHGEDVGSYLKGLISKLESKENVNIMLNTKVKKSLGSVGNFVTTLVQDGQEIELKHAVTIIATGGEASTTDEYLYGKNEKVVLWSELSQRLASDPEFAKSLNSVVFIQCVGSRDNHHAYCSNICCSFSIKTALQIKAQNPDAEIYIINRDIRTPGSKELLYREAREKGVIFIRYDLDKKPLVQETEDGKLNVIVFDPILEKDILIKADLLSLQTAIEPTSNKEVSEIFGISLDEDGFFKESP